MALTQNNPILASDINALKNRVKNEMARRNGVGSLAGYAGSWSVSSGTRADAKHYNETVGYIAKIKAVSGLASSVSSGNIIYAINAASTRLSSNEGYSKTANSTDCASSCTGLCYTQCTGGCRGCTSCSGCSSCTGTCVGGCTSCTSCSGCSGCSGCSDACSGCTGCTSCSGCDGCTGCGDSCQNWCNQACWVDWCWTNSSYY